MPTRLDPRSPEFDALYLEVGDRASGWLVAESLDDPSATTSWLTLRLRRAEQEADKRRFEVTS